MIINTVYLFSTPLDKNYNNVIDFNKANINTYLQSLPITQRTYSYAYLKVLLNSNFIHYIDNFNTRAVKVTDSGCFITIPRDYHDILDCNYVALKLDRYDYEYIFGFITDKVSENDNPINPSTTLTITFDVWANNLDYLTNDTSINKTVCKHYDRSYIDNDGYRPNFLYRPNESLDVYKSTYGTSKKLLFLVLEIAPYIGDTPVEYPYKALFSDGEEEYPVFISPLTSDQYRKELLYCPVALLNESVNKLVSARVRSTVNTSYTWGTTTTIQVNKIFTFSPDTPLGGSLSGSLTTYVTKAYYSYHSPFEYSISGDDVYINYPMFEMPLNDTSSVPVIAALGNKFNKTTKWEVIEVNYGSYEQFKIRGDGNVIENIEIPLSYIIDTQRVTDPDYINIETEPVNNRYPLNYKSLVYNGTEVFLDPINLYSRNTVDVEIKCLTAQPKVEIFMDGIRFINIAGTYLQNSGMITYSVDALDDYLIRNGNKVETEQIFLALNGLVNTAKSTVIGGWAGLALGVYNYVQEQSKFNATFSDLNNTPSTVHSYTGEDDIVYQDRVIVVNNTCTDSINKNKLLNEIFLYGYPLYDESDILTNVRAYFDYVRTENCKINGSMSEYNREQLEQIFNRGVIKNHAYLFSDNTIIKPTFIHQIDEIPNYEVKYGIPSNSTPISEEI